MIRLSSDAQQIHSRARVNAESQADLLNALLPELTPDEQELVRRARNLKATGTRRSDQGSYRLATAFEALLGYLYLHDSARLTQILQLTLHEALQPGAGAEFDNEKP